MFNSFFIPLINPRFQYKIRICSQRKKVKILAIKLTMNKNINNQAKNKGSGQKDLVYNQS